MSEKVQPKVSTGVRVIIESWQNEWLDKKFAEGRIDPSTEEQRTEMKRLLMGMANADAEHESSFEHEIFEHINAMGKFHGMTPEETDLLNSRVAQLYNQFIEEIVQFCANSALTLSDPAKVVNDGSVQIH